MNGNSYHNRMDWTPGESSDLQALGLAFEPPTPWQPTEAPTQAHYGIDQAAWLLGHDAEWVNQKISEELLETIDVDGVPAVTLASMQTFLDINAAIAEAMALN